MRTTCVLKLKLWNSSFEIVIIHFIEIFIYFIEKCEIFNNLETVFFIVWDKLLEKSYKHNYSNM